MKRKLRKIANCLVCTIPSQLADVCNFKEGDYVEIVMTANFELKLRKIPS